jgi:hypothetical protein
VYEVVDETGQVLAVEQVGDNLVKSHYDMIYHIELTADKLTILPDGVDTATITATIKDYLGNPYDYSGDLTVMVAGDQHIFTAASGMVEQILITSDYETDIDVSAFFPKCRAGGIGIVAQNNP